MIRTIGLFLLLLLKILGWALLILLLLLIAILLLVLFVPLRYDVQMQNERSMEPGQNNPIAGLQLQLKVNWLLHLLHVAVSYGPEGMQNKIYVAGIDVRKVLAQLANRKEKKRRRKVQKSHNRPQAKNSAAKADKSDQIQMQAQTEPENSRIFSDTETETEEDRQVKPEKAQSAENGSEADTEEQTFVLKEKEPPKKQGTSKPESQKRRESSKKRNRKKASKTKRQKKPAKKDLRTQLSRLHKEFTDEVNRHAVGHLWKELLKLLRSYKPGKLKANLTFSLANPALTGGAVGVISLMPWIYRYPCSIVPDFTSEKLYIEGEILARGKVTVFVFVFSLLWLLRDKEFMQVVRRVMKRDRS